MTVLPAVLLVTALGSLALWQATEGFRTLTAEGARRLNVAAAKPSVPNISLEAMTGRTLWLRSAAPKVSLIEFIYTSCPTICQSAGSDFARLRERLLAAGLGDRVRLLSVSFDPVTDSVKRLALYGELHGADGTIWTVVRPQAPELRRLLRSFGVVVIPDDFGGYQHNVALHVVDPAGRLIAVLDSDDLDGALQAVRRALP